MDYSQSSSPFPDSLPLVIIPLLLLVAIVGASLLVNIVLVFLDFDASVNPSLAPSAVASTASLTLGSK